MLRHRLTDEQWDLIADLFAKPKPTGRPPSDPRQMVDGVLWILHTGVQWRDLPRDFGPKSTVWDHFDRWNGDGSHQRIRCLLLYRWETHQGDIWGIRGKGGVIDDLRAALQHEYKWHG